jgi:hypothetical protein
MGSGRPRDPPLAFSPPGVGEHRMGTSTARRAPSLAGESAVAMLGCRPEPCIACATVGAWLPSQSVLVGRPTLPLRTGCWHGVIHVLRHDLPRRASHANISIVERKATDLSSSRLGRTGAPAAADCSAAVDDPSVFITRLQGRRRWLRRLSDSPAIRSIEPSCEHALARSCASSSEDCGVEVASRSEMH